MKRVRALTVTRGASIAPPVSVGLRTCGPYRALTVGDSHRRAKLIYDSNGRLIAVLERMDVVDVACGNDPEAATIHYGRHVDCTETDLLFSAP